MPAKPTTAPKASKRETELAAEVRTMEKLAKAAEGRGSFSAAVAARAKISALRTELDRLRSEREAESEPDPLARTSRLRRLATEAGSYVAAAGLAKLEAELTAAREAAAAATRGDGFEAASDAEILAAIEAAILALPDPLVVRIRDCAVDRLDGKKLRVVGGA